MPTRYIYVKQRETDFVANVVSVPSVLNLETNCTLQTVFRKLLDKRCSVVLNLYVEDVFVLQCDSHDCLTFLLTMS